MAGLLALIGLLAACREEPTIVIHFEPRDLAAAARPATERAVIADAAVVGSVATPGPPDGGGGTLAASPAGVARAPVKAPPKPESPSTRRREPGEAGEASGGAAECAADADCVAIKADCCGCNQGGRAQAVPKKRQADALRALEKECGAMTMCVQMISTHPSCRSHAACRQHRCVLAD